MKELKEIIMSCQQRNYINKYSIIAGIKKKEWNEDVKLLKKIVLKEQHTGKFSYE